MRDASRRDILLASTPVLAALAAPASAFAPTMSDVSTDLARYVGFGGKAAGGPGDTACGAWLEQELITVGYKVERQSFTAAWFDPARAYLVSGAARASVIPQAIVSPTGPGGVSGPLVRIDPLAGPAAPLAGAIALVDLPFARWSSALVKAVRDPVTAAFAAGAAGVVIITNGPTGDALALNARGDIPTFAGPTAVIAPRDAAPFLRAAAAANPATLTIDGKGGRRDAFNLIGRLDRSKGRWLVVSTPRSGWFTCAGERGPGIAAWLALARWAASAITTHDLAFVGNSGHEYENLGSAHLLDHAAPPADRTDLWLHLGANVAARDWHDIGGRLLPLPSADPQRLLVTSPDLIAPARAAFAGLPGLEAPYPTGQGTAGELTNIVAAGYRRVAGIFGAHRYHHSSDDDLRCVDAALVAPVIAACQALLRTG